MKKEQLPYICFSVIREKQKWFDDFFRLLDIPQDRILYADKPLRFRRIIVPDESVHSWHSFHPNYMLPYRKIVSAVEPSPCKKIYLTRTSYKINGTQCVNEEYFERFFEERGFKVIVPENHTIEEQISFVSGADVLATTLGTTSHFALFAKPGTKVIGLTRSSRETLPPQCLITEAAKGCCYIVDVASNFLNENRCEGVSVIGSTSYWKRFVNDFFGEECRDVIDQNTYMYYFTEWLRYYKNPKNYYKIRDIDNFDMLRQSVKVLLNEELDKTKYNIGKTKKEYQIIVENQEKTIASYKENCLEIRLHNAYRIRQKNCMNQCFAQMHQYDLIDTKDDLPILQRMFRGKDIITVDLICYKVHGADYGWTDICYESEAAGRRCSGKRLEAFQLDSMDGGVQFVYSAYIDGQGWSDNVSNGEIAGTVGKALPMRSVRISLVNNNGLDFSVRYRASLNGQWSEYAYDGEVLDTFEWKYFEALQIELVLNPTVCNNTFYKIAQIKEDEKKEKQRLTEHVSSLNQEINRQQENNNELMDEIYKLNNEIQELKIWNSQLENSFSWRITKPFRIIRFWWLNRKNK